MKLLALTAAIVISTSALAQHRPRPRPRPLPIQTRAQMEQQALRLSNRVQRMTQTKVDQLERRELRALINKLQDARNILQGNLPNPRPIPGPIPVPRPQPQPQPIYNACELVGKGVWGSSSYEYNYRVSVNGNVLFGTDSWSTLLSRVSEMQSSGICELPTYNQSVCTFTGKGAWGRSSYEYNYRIMLGNDVVYASDSYDTVKTRLDSLRNNNLCTPVAAGSCDFMGQGTWGRSSYNYSYTVGINGLVVYGTDSFSTATSRMNDMRSEGLCF